MLLQTLQGTLAFENVATAKISSVDAKTVEFTFANGLELDEYNFEFAKGLVKDKSRTR